jgi:hypothetical protein
LIALAPGILVAPAPFCLVMMWRPMLSNIDDGKP